MNPPRQNWINPRNLAKKLRGTTFNNIQKAHSCTPKYISFMIFMYCRNKPKNEKSDKIFVISFFLERSVKNPERLNIRNIRNRRMSKFISF